MHVKRTPCRPVHQRVAKAAGFPYTAIVGYPRTARWRAPATRLRQARQGTPACGLTTRFLLWLSDGKHTAASKWILLAACVGCQALASQPDRLRLNGVMRTILQDEFLDWAAARGLGIEPTYAETWPRNLAFTRPQAESRYWCIPDEAASVPWFLDVLVTRLGAWKHLYLWPKSARWLETLAEGDHAPARYVASTLRSFWSSGCAIEFGRDDATVLTTLLFCAACFGESAWDDVYMVPEEADAFLMVDHHLVVWAKFASAVKCAAYVEALQKQGIELPTEPPDETFKPVPWMEPGTT